MNLVILPPPNVAGSLAAYPTIEVNAVIIGSVINAVDDRKSGYYYGYNKDYYHYYTEDKK